MSFRNDHDAALARADALEAELAAERQKAESAQQQLDAERAERKRLEAQLGQRVRERAPPVEHHHKPDPNVVGIEPRFDPVGIGLTIAVIFALLLFVLAVAQA